MSGGCRQATVRPGQQSRWSDRNSAPLRALAAVFSVRLLGLFMIYPVFAAYAGSAGRRESLPDRRGARYLWPDAGAAADSIRPVVGPGRPQGHDRLRARFCSARQCGRRVSGSIGGVIIGRALQGTGAVGSVILALVADLTSGRKPHPGDGDRRHHHRRLVHDRARSRPDRATFVGVGGIFWLMVGLALARHRDHANSWCRTRVAFACIAMPRRCRR